MTGKRVMSEPEAAVDLAHLCVFVDRPWRFFSRTGEPLTITECVEAFRDLDTRDVATTVVGGYRVSTAWLGVDHGTPDAPRLFETMVFRGARGRTDLAQARYATEAEARAGHVAMCQRVYERLQREMDEVD